MRNRIGPRTDAGSVRASVTVGAVLVGLAVLAGTTVGGAVPVDAGNTGNVTFGAVASDVEIGDETQSIAFKFGQVESGGEVDLYANVTSLETAGIDLATVKVDVTEIHNANLTDGAVVDENGTVTVRLSLAFDDGAERAFVDTRLTGLDTSDAEHVTRLHHYVAVSEQTLVGENAPDAENTVVAYDVVETAPADGDQQPHTQVSPSDVAIGGDTQTLRIRVADATADFGLDVDLVPLIEAGVGVENAAVEVDETDRLGVSTARVVDGSVHLDVAANAQTGYIRITLAGLETRSASPSEELQYPVSVDDDPADPHESSPFDVFDPDERDDETPGDDETVTPTALPGTTDASDGEDGDTVAGSDTSTDTETPTQTASGSGRDGDTASQGTTADQETAGSGPGFGFLVAVAVLVVTAVGDLIRRRWL